MMTNPMLLSRLIDHAAEHHGDTPFVARRIDGVIERSDWARMRDRAKRLANAMTGHGFKVDDVVGSLAWNTSNHIELFYAALGIGAGLHTLNPRLTAEDLRYMIEKVGEITIFIDADTLPLAEQVAAITPMVIRWVFMDEPGAPVPASALPGFVTKTDFIGDASADFAWPTFDENQAATICFTSGTTGRPKGVAYTHRSITLGSMNMSMADMYGTHRRGSLECMLPIAAIFHANGWMMPFTAPMNGHKLVLNGRDFSPEGIIELIDGEGVTITGAVPTIWMDLFDAADRQGSKLETVRTGLLAGTRPSRALAERFESFGITLCQSWGMTEVPGCSRSAPAAGSDTLPADEQHERHLARQGRVGFLSEMRIVDDEGKPLPFDGEHAGHLLVRGPIASGSYVGLSDAEGFEWLETGDIARIYPDGSMEIVDRAKDVIKSGGEWISTLQLESAAASFAGVAEAGVISIPHPRWQERPLMLVTLAEGVEALDEAALRAHMQGFVAKWWLPDAIRVIDMMPRTSTGKLDKMALRRLYAQRSENIIA
ncbi:AMP-binding protein [Novosphingobium resinovorum]|uniref:AMP-binding protein n=2 Tax=Sphingomonadaceae TaxID=41297 RepID=UPI0022F25C42|nr:AMP-binding protein [Novosphingobium resinovorum]